MTIALGFLPTIDAFEVSFIKNPKIIINENSPIYKNVKNKTLFINSQIAQALAYYIGKNTDKSIDETVNLYQDKTVTIL